jgi:hypothetical protein
MIFLEAKYHFRKAILIGTIFLWSVFLFWVIWFTYSSDKMSALDIIVKEYDKNIMLRDCQRQAFEYLHKKLSHDRSLHDHVFWNYFWDAYRDREPTRTDNSVWEIGVIIAQSYVFCVVSGRSLFVLSSIYWPYHCLCLFNIWVLITPLISSNFKNKNYVVVYQ